MTGSRHAACRLWHMGIGLALPLALWGCSAPAEEAAEDVSYDASVEDSGDYGEVDNGTTTAAYPPAAETPSPAPDLDLPAYPQWPPEPPSSRRVLDSMISSREGMSLYDAGEGLREALEAAGYYQQTYYSIPGGFLLATETERIAEDGGTLPIDERNRRPGDDSEDSLWAGIRDLFLERPPTLYRYIAIVVTNQPFTTARDEDLDTEEAAERTQGGSSNLTSRARTIPFSEDFQVTALIYEFQNDGIGYDLEPLAPGKLDPQTHLVKSGLAASLEQQFGGGSN